MTSGAADLVGRQAESAQLFALLDEVSDGSSRVLEISGPAGIGKTALLDQLEHQARERDLLCLRSAGFAAEQDQPFGVLLDLLDQVGEHLSELGSPDESSARAEVSEPLRPVQRILDRLGAMGVGSGELSGSEELAVCRTVRAVFSDFASEARALVVIVDDVQWSDEATDAVLGYLARHDLGLPLLLALSARNLDGGLVPTGLSQQTTPAIRRLQVGPLSRGESEQLLWQVPADRRPTLVQACGGNPFYAVQLAQHHTAASVPRDRDEGERTSGIPQSVLRSIVTELDVLGGNARRLVEAAAILGDPFASDQAAGMVGLSNTELALAIDELLSTSLIVRSEGGMRFCFRHPILAAATLESIPTGTLQHLHGRAAALLRQAGSDGASVARHLEHSADVGDLDSVGIIAAAAEENRSLAPATSARLFASALRLLPTGPEQSAARMRYMDGRADCLIRMGEFEQAHQMLLNALDLVSADDAFGQAWLTINCVRVEEWLGLDDTATVRLERMWRKFVNRPGPERALLEGLLMLRASERGDVAEMRSFGERVVATMAAVPHPYVDLTLSSGRALCEARIGSVAEARAFVDRAAVLSEQLSEQELSAAVEPLLFLSSAELWLGMAEAGLSHALLGLRFSQRNNNALAGVRLGMACESGMTALGRLSEAAEVIDDGEQVARQLRQLNATCYLVGRRCALAGLRGDWVAAERAAEECEAYLDRVTDATHRALASFSIARTLLATDRAEDCVNLIVEQAGGEELRGVPGPLRGMVYEVLVEADLALGRTDEAAGWASRATAAADQWSTPVAECWANRSTARMHSAEGSHEEAVAAATRAVAAVVEADAPMETAFSQLLRGQVLAAAGGRTSDAVDALRAAQVTFEEAGAAGLLQQVGRALRDLGVATVPRQSGSRPTLGSLSRREQDVAELIAEGLTNPAIASRLYVSARTVESHVSRIFTKLGVNNRSEVGRLVRQARLLDDLDGAETGS